MTRLRHDPGERLAAAILAHGADAGCTPVLVALDQRDWVSATFAGRRLCIVLAVAPGLARRNWLASLPESTFTVPGHCVADLAPVATADPHHVSIEVLLLTEA